MRRFEKTLINDLLDKLTDIHKSISSEYKAGRTESAVDLLCRCQDSAIGIGNLIESREGKDCPSIKFLERYCDSLYSSAQKIVTKTITKNDFDAIRKHYYNICQSIEKEIPIRLEMVFLPYQASMWDSLESIWKTAQEDPDCNAFVVPIPYFERKPDGSLGDMHYDGDRFPDYVPITHYTKYNLSTRKPDAVFIHNPYDANNFVTMVAPEYFSTELKKHTDCLVYVPYFVFASMDGKKDHFFTVPGVLNADYVIVQSEQIRNAYINAYEQYTGKIANKNKYLPLGSPLLDKVISTKRKDVSVPDEWNNKIAGKKVVLYNTSIKEILDHKEKTLEKIEGVFRTFQKQKNVVLLWRPHPLIPATIGSMLPHLLEKYQNLVEQFKKNNCGIYDDTPDVYRAIAISAAYYGDGGSLLITYGMTGKPIMVQNYSIQNFINPDSTNYNAGFNCFVECEDAYWVSAYYFNGLFKIDKKTMEPQYMGSFPGEPHDEIRLFAFALKLKDDIYFCPGSAKSIAKYSLSKNTFSSIELPGFFYSKMEKRSMKYKFYQCAAYNNVIFFFGLLYPGIIYYNISSCEFGTIEDIDCEIDINSPPFFGQMYPCGKYVVTILQNQNKIFTLDMENKTVSIASAAESESGFIGICFDGKDYWITPNRNGPLLCFKRESQKAVTAASLPPLSSDNTDNLKRFVRMVAYKNAIWLFPHSHSEVLRFDPCSMNMETIKDLSQALRGKTEKSGKVRFAWSDNGYIYIFSENYPFLFKYSPDTGVETIDLTINKDDEYIIKNKIVYQKCKKYFKLLMKESDRFGLLEYLAFVMFDSSYNNSKTIDFRKYSNFIDGSAGINIFQTIKTQLN